MKLSIYLLLLIFSLIFVICKVDKLADKKDYYYQDEDGNEDDDDDDKFKNDDDNRINDNIVEFQSKTYFKYFKSPEEELQNLNFKDMQISWSFDLCKNVQCQKNQHCVIKSKNLAVCVDLHIPKSFKMEKKIYKAFLYRDSTTSDSDFRRLEKCKPCSLSQSKFYCGTDNSTYPSLCRLQLHNCVHNSTVQPLCKGFCPCTNLPLSSEKKAKLFQTKYKNKIDELNKKNKYQKYFLNKNKPFLDQISKINEPYLPLNKKIQIKRCTKQDLKIIETRLLDWFSVVFSVLKRTEDGIKKDMLSSFSFSDCSNKITNIFYHLDNDRDLRLSLKELFDLEHNQREPCLKQYLDNCDENQDTFIDPYEWCYCFDHKSRPCANEFSKRKRLIGAYIPQCDQNGFYKSLQCHSSIGKCWCVDKYGVEFLNTRQRGKVNCEKLDDFSIDNSKEKQKDGTKKDETIKKNENYHDDDDDNDNDKDENIDNGEGSGDNE